MSRFPLYRQPKSTHYSKYIVEILLEMYDTLTDSTLPLKSATINYYQGKDPGIQAKLLCAKHKKVLFVEAGILLH